MMARAVTFVRLAEPAALSMPGTEPSGARVSPRTEVSQSGCLQRQEGVGSGVVGQRRAGFELMEPRVQA